MKLKIERDGVGKIFVVRWTITSNIQLLLYRTGLGLFKHKITLVKK